MNKTIMYEKEILLSNKAFLTNFGIELQNPKYKTKRECTIKGPFKPIVYMQDGYGFDYGVVTIFSNMLYIENNLLYSKFQNPIIDKVMESINDLLCIFESCRFRYFIDRKLIFSPVLNRLHPKISFIHLTREDKFIIFIEFYIPSFDENGESIPKAKLITKDIILDDFQFIKLSFDYSSTGDLLTGNFFDYREKIFNIWKINESSTKDDYKKLGLLTDMMNI